MKIIQFLEGHSVSVDTSMMHKQDKDPDGWNAATAKVPAATVTK